MISKLIKTVTAATFALALAAPSLTAAQAQTADSALIVSEAGVIKVKSAYPLDETIARIKQDIASKGITFFLAVDQSKLAADAGIKLRPSTLLVFGNPALGSQFITSNPQSGLDWPVRLLVQQDDNGDVSAYYTDFAWIARRFAITDREPQFKMASSVVESITSTIKAKQVSMAVESDALAAQLGLGRRGAAGAVRTSDRGAALTKSRPPKHLRRVAAAQTLSNVDRS